MTPPIGSRIKIRHLDAFTAIARAGSLKQAGAALNLTQPAISRTLKELEDILGVVLMERSRSGVRLTAEGEVFLAYAEQSLAALRTGLGRVTARGGAEVILSVGALPSVLASLLPRAVARLGEVAPDVTVRLVEGAHDVLLDRLRSGALDLVVGRLGPPGAMHGVSFTQLYTEDVVIVAAPDHPAARVQRPEDLAAHLVIYPPEGSAIRPLVARYLIGLGVPLFANRIETASAAFGRAMVLGERRAVWFISRGVVADDLAEGRMVALPIDLGPTIGPVGLMARSGEPGLAQALVFRDIVLAMGEGRSAT